METMNALKYKTTGRTAACDYNIFLFPLPPETDKNVYSSNHAVKFETNLAKIIVNCKCI